MSIEAAFVAKLDASEAVAGLAAKRVYPALAPQGAPLPYITYTTVATTPENTTNGESGTSNTRLQVDCWARSYTNAKAVAAAVRTAISGWRDQTSTPSVGRALLIDERDEPQNPQDAGEVPVHRVIQEYSIWYSE